MQSYVVGFAFTEAKNLVLLINKDHPEWQRGLLNGVGGKIEEGETAIQAMHRECNEEVGLKLNWRSGGMMHGVNNDKRPFRCWFFYAYDNRVMNHTQRESEYPALYRTDIIHNLKTIANVQYLVPIGVYHDNVLFITLEY